MASHVRRIRSNGEDDFEVARPRRIEEEDDEDVPGQQIQVHHPEEPNQGGNVHA